MMRYAMFLSVHPKYAQRILEGKKTVELRRMRPRVSEGAVLLLYVSSPVKALKALSVIESVTSAQPDELWRQLADKAAIARSEFDDYFAGAQVGFAIHLGDVQRLSTPISLSNLRELWPNFKPPQSYQYFTKREFATLLEIVENGGETRR